MQEEPYPGEMEHPVESPNGLLARASEALMSNDYENITREMPIFQKAENMLDALPAFLKKDPLYHLLLGEAKYLRANAHKVVRRDIAARMFFEDTVLEIEQALSSIDEEKEQELKEFSPSFSLETVTFMLADSLYCLSRLSTPPNSAQFLRRAASQYEILLETGEISLQRKAEVLNNLACCYFGLMRMDKAASCYLQIQRSLNSDDIVKQMAKEGLEHIEEARMSN